MIAQAFIILYNAAVASCSNSKGVISMSSGAKDILKKGASLSEDALEKVAGGVKVSGRKVTSVVDPQAKYQEMEAAFASMGFFSHGFTRHQMDALCDQWEAEGFPGTAESFLIKAKNW